ncbi:MAG TPA: hypothetical protein VLU96_11135 [Gaiellaceae bacterium]|nr:hypothetical protein [Gaiellaceae bacterium]
MRPALLLFCAALVVAGCSSSRPSIGPVGPARTFALSGFQPVRMARPGVHRLSFTIRQPSGAPLTTYRTGPGPHVGVHLIVVRRDLGAIIHRHPPVGANGRIVQAVDFPTPGPYRVLVDAYPAVKGGPRNFQLHQDVRVAGPYRPQPLPPFSRTVDVDGYRVVLSGPRTLHAIEPAYLVARVTDPRGRPVTFRPWYGALAHAIFFRNGTLDYFHTHVCGPSTPGCTSVLGGTSIKGLSTKPGKLQVGVLLPVAGTWRLFLQFQGGGRILTAPFTLTVR